MLRGPFSSHLSAVNDNLIMMMRCTIGKDLARSREAPSLWCKYSAFDTSVFEPQTLEFSAFEVQILNSPEWKGGIIPESSVRCLRRR